MNNMDPEFKKFLDTKCKKQNKATHVAPTIGSYTVLEQDLEQFYKFCHEEFFKNNKKYQLTEMFGDVCKFVVDIDLKYKENHLLRQYTSETVSELINLSINVLSNLIVIDKPLNVLVFEKPKIRKCDKNEYKSKDGFHLVFPDIKANREIYKKFTELMIEEVNADIFYDIMENTCQNKSDNDIKDIIDSIYHGQWLIYGSRKNGENSKYKLTQSFQWNNNELTPLDTDLQSNMSLIKNNSVYNTNPNVEYTELGEEYLKTKNLNSNNNIVPELDIDMQEENNTLSYIVNENIKLISLLVSKLSPERADTYASWRDLGLLLNNISKSKIMFEIWDNFSKKSSEYNKKACIDKWNHWKTISRKENVLTIRTLHWWVKQDIPLEEYRNIIKDSLEGKINLSLEGEKTCGTHYDVSNVIADYYKNEFVCSGIKENYWFYFNENIGGKWEQTEVGHELRKRLSGEIVEIYAYYLKKYQALSQSYPEGSDWRKLYDMKVANCGKVIAKLKDSNYKDKIIRECRELFYDPEFEDKKNSKLHLLGFDNGVMDLENMVFRKGQPDDFITISTKYSIPVNVSKPIEFSELYDNIINDSNNQFVSDLMDFIKKVLPDRKSNDTNDFTDSRVREYVLRFLSSCLSGEVREEKFYFWTGTGGNGKSKLVELLSLALGDYCKTLDVAYLTTKRGSSSSASPEIEALKYARFVSCSEPEEHDKIYVGKLKEITGGDKLTTRGLFKETTEFKPQFKIALMCNHLPKLQNQDGGTWRRIEVVDFISKFDDKPEPTAENPYHYLADLDLPKRLKEWKLYFMLILLSKYGDYKKLGTKPPEEVKNGTQQYKQDSDKIFSWFQGRTEECPNNENGFAPTSLDVLYDDFKTWAQDESFDKKDLPPKKKIREELNKLQEKSTYKAQWGKNCRNGTQTSPKYNFKISI